MTHRTMRRAFACALFASTCLATPALGQDASTAAFPIRQYQDANGVDLLSVTFVASSPKISIGDEEMGLDYTRQIRLNTFRDNLMWNVSNSGSTYIVSLGPRSETFTLSGSTFTPTESNGSSLSLSGSTYTYTAADGTVATFDTASYFFGNARGNSVQSVTYPNGKALTFHYLVDSFPILRGTRSGRRLQAVTSNTGYMIHPAYASNDPTTDNGVSWSRITQVKALNTSVDSCSPFGTSCPETGRPVLNISGSSYTDAEGRTTSYTFSGTTLTGIRYPGSSSDDVTIVWTSGKVSSVTRAGVTDNYSYSDDLTTNVRTVTVTHADSSTRVATFDLIKNVMLTDQNEVGKTTSYQYDGNNRLSRVTLPEGNYTQLTYDGRGNITERRNVAKSGSGLSDIVSTAAFASTCSNAVTCNQPTSTTDARGNTTDYTYDSTHGGLLTVTRPAPSTGATRPQLRVTYSRLGSNGSSSSIGIFVPTAASECQMGSSCSGTADELLTTISYGQGLLPSSVSRGAGDASLTATSALTYDAVGNITYLDGPLSGSADTSRIIYNQDREVIGTISADPDGAGSLANKATRITYGSSGLITRRELGTTIGQTDAAWSAFSPSNAIDISYDGNRRPITRTLGSGGTNYALTQTSYDNRGRLVCTAVRMNAAAFSSLPSDACTLGTTGSYGPDRIAKATYDVASRISSMQQAYGTSDQATDRAITYTDNGEATALTDAENNLTAYSFDGFDRLIKVTFANPTKGAGTTNSSDYEQISYDANGNVTSRRLRDGNVIYLTLDNLNRLTLKDLPGSEPDVTYSYDNLDRLTSASQTGNSQSYTYDALGRKLTEVGQLGTATSTWNLDGTRATLALPGGGITLTYDRLVTGEVSKIRENGATSGIGVLAAYGYNSLLNRTSVAFGNGVNTSYSYDAVSRLASLSHDVAGTGDDLTIGSISYNPASQIASLTRSNDAYAWTGHGTGSTTTVTNGLNQLATVGGVSGTHDARGNLTADPVSGNGYGYSSENLLSSATVGVYSVTLAYDPTMRLSQVTGPSTTRFGYDGVDLVAEDNGSGILLRRYVPGPGSDEAVVWYEGTGTADRRFLQTDERGSVVGVTDASGNILARNTYDEYGKPGSSNSGRIQYTGQKWIAELGLYDFKNRMYDPRTARFLQTDPIGQADDVNVYTYVAGDPVNKTDPLGLAGEDKDARVEVIGHRGAFGKLLNQRFSIRRAIESFNGLKDDIEREIFIIGSRRVTNAILEAQRYTAQPFIADKEMKVLIAELKLFGEKYPNSRSYDMSILDPEQIWAEIVIIAMKPPYLTSNGTWVVPINDRITAIYYTPTRSPDRSTGIGIRVGGTETKFKWR